MNSIPLPTHPRVPLESDLLRDQDSTTPPLIEASDQQPTKKQRHNNTKPFHHPTCCNSPQLCELYGSPVLIKHTQLNRILYTNPVCLLTSVSTPLPLSPPPSSFLFNPPSQNPNVMTISWITPTDNNGHFFASLNADRFSAQNILKTKRFVLNIPVAGMESVVKEIGRCSGANNSPNPPPASDGAEITRRIPDSSFSKFQKLNIATECAGWRSHPLSSPEAINPTSTTHLNHEATQTPVLATTPRLPTPNTTSISELRSILSSETFQLYYNHAYQLIKRAYQGDKKESNPEVQELIEDIIVSLYYGDITLPQCVAHAVCEVLGYIAPQLYKDQFSAETSPQNGHATHPGVVGEIGTPGHYSIFGKIKLGWVRKNYWQGSLFQPLLNFSKTTTSTAEPKALTSPQLPPYLTFLSQGEFLYSTRPEMFPSHPPTPQ